MPELQYQDKRPVKPNKGQRVKIELSGLNPSNWLVQEDTRTELVKLMAMEELIDLVQYQQKEIIRLEGRVKQLEHQIQS